LKTQRPVAVGFVALPEKLSGTWPAQGLPERVKLYGREFVRSRRWAFPYLGVRAQYREDVDHRSMHLMVYSDGHFEIDHMDDANPERGHVLEHTMRDVAATKLGGVVVGLGVVALAGALAWLVSKLED